MPPIDNKWIILNLSAKYGCLSDLHKKLTKVWANKLANTLLHIQNEGLKHFFDKIKPVGFGVEKKKTHHRD